MVLNYYYKLELIYLRIYWVSYCAVKVEQTSVIYAVRKNI